MARFNGWAKYENHLRDEAAGNAIPSLVCVDFWRPGMVLEGGSVDVNGAGLLLTTEECLLSPIQATQPRFIARGDRNGPWRLPRNRIASSGCAMGIAGDDVHGYIDDSARFTDPDTVVIASEDDWSDANYEPLRENWPILSHFPARGSGSKARPRRSIFDGPAASGECCQLFYRLTGRYWFRPSTT